MPHLKRGIEISLLHAFIPAQLPFEFFLCFRSYIDTAVCSLPHDQLYEGRNIRNDIFHHQSGKYHNQRKYQHRNTDYDVMLYAGQRRFERQRKLQRRFCLLKRNLIPLKAVGLYALTERCHRFNPLNSPGSRYYRQRHRARQDPEACKKRQRQKTDLVRYAGL